MADSKITALGSIGTGTDPANDQLVIVDVSDVLPTGMATTGTTKRVSLNNLLASSPTATLASATITGALTVGTTLGVTGVSTFAAGTALLPALTTTGDTNTGIYFPAADTFAVTTAGVERYRVDSTGLGVGVSPSAKLDVLANDATIAIFRGSGASSNDKRLTITSGGLKVVFNISDNSNTATARAYEFQSAGSSVMTIDASGNLLVNVPTTAPTLATNSQMVFNLTSNTNLRISVRGTDGTTRTANITLA
jgi:hypothetical protein